MIAGGRPAPTAVRAWPRAPPASTGLNRSPSAQNAAHDYNPFGTGPENRDQVGNVVDNDPNTTWSTEQYYYGTLEKPGGVGLGSTSTPPPG